MSSGRNNLGIDDAGFDDAALRHIDELLASAGATDRTAATRERLDRVVAATTPLLTPPAHAEITYQFPMPAAIPARSGSRRGMLVAAGLALMLSVGAAVMALRTGSHPVPGEQTLASAVDAATDLDMVDALFADSGLGDTWTDAEALHTRVSADLNSYWGSDDIFGGADAQNGESL